jgi:hypothetical protein
MSGVLLADLSRMQTQLLSLPMLSRALIPLSSVCLTHSFDEDTFVR